MIDGQGPGVIALAAVFLLVNIVFIGLRVYTKARIARTFGWNDVGMITVVVSPLRFSERDIRKDG